MKRDKSIAGGEDCAPAGFSILAIADLHYMSDEDYFFIDNFPACDIVLLLGDITKQVAERITNNATAKNIPVLYVLGNHDDLGQLTTVQSAIDLDGKVIEISGIRFGGMSGGPRYKRGTQFMRTQEEADALLSSLPPCDVFVTHEGPYHMFHEDTPHEGFRAIDEYIKEKRPSLHLFGHQHIRYEGLVLDTKSVCVYRAALISFPDFSIKNLL